MVLQAAISPWNPHLYCTLSFTFVVSNGTLIHIGQNVINVISQNVQNILPNNRNFQSLVLENDSHCRYIDIDYF
jgi:hypothetical protein